jgi:hypothetical protein
LFVSLFFSIAQRFAQAMFFPAEMPGLKRSRARAIYLSSATGRRISGAQRNQFGGASRWREAKRDKQSESDEFQNAGNAWFHLF